MAWLLILTNPWLGRSRSLGSNQVGARRRERQAEVSARIADATCPAFLRTPARRPQPECGLRLSG